MEYMTFGRETGLRVSEYALGTGNFGTCWGGGAEPLEARRIFDRFASAGGTFIDTANSYQFGEAEMLLGECLKADRDHFVVATKFTQSDSSTPGISTTGNNRKNMVRSLEASLGRLGTEYVDLYWAHMPDTLTPMEEILRGFDDLVSAGKILHAGLSNFPAWRTARAAAIADLRGWAPIVGVQIAYSLVERGPDRDQLPMVEALGLGAALFSPLGGGLLTGKYRKSDKGRLSDWKHTIWVEDTPQRSAIIDKVLVIAAETGASPSQVAVAWLREVARHAGTAYVPIIGPRDVSQLDDYLGALEVSLDKKQLRDLDEVSAVVPAGINPEAVLAVTGVDAALVRRAGAPRA
jgi:aryl-alcohol dehydrogenase-like predicted oxidoreductase